MNLSCLTGLSGSGKSSLAFDTIYAEGQRRYMESLSSYARQFLRTDGKTECGEDRRDCPRRFPSTRNLQTAIRVQRWEPSRRFMIISVCCMQESESHIVQNVEKRSKNRR